MAGRSKAPISAPSQTAGTYLLVVMWEISSRLSVEVAERRCQADAAKVLPVVRGRRPIRITATPFQTFVQSTLTTCEELS